MGERGYVLQSGAVRESEVNAFMSSLMLRGNLKARGNFDSLPIPFRAIATDVATRGTVVLSSGDLARAVRASAAIPVVLRPVQIGDQWLVDGGIAENTPVKVARERGAQRSWISLLPVRRPRPEDVRRPVHHHDGPAQLALRTGHDHDGVTRRAHHERDEGLREPGFRPGDDGFARRRSVARRRAPRSRPPCASGRFRSAARAVQTPTIVKQVGFSGVRIVDGDLVLDELGVAAGQPLDIGKLDAGITTMGQSERYRALWLQPGGSGADVTLHVQLDPAPQRSFGVGVAFDQFMSGRLWVGGIDRTLLSGDAEGVGAGSPWHVRAGPRRLRAATRAGRNSVTCRSRWRPSWSTRACGSSPATASCRRRRPVNSIGFVGLKQDPRVDVWHGEIGLDARLWREPLRDTRGTFGLRASLFRAASEYEMGSHRRSCSGSTIFSAPGST